MHFHQHDAMYNAIIRKYPINANTPISKCTSLYKITSKYVPRNAAKSCKIKNTAPTLPSLMSLNSKYFRKLRQLTMIESSRYKWNDAMNQNKVNCSILSERNCSIEKENHQQVDSHIHFNKCKYNQLEEAVDEMIRQSKPRPMQS
jgi:hypothetical protein